MKNVKKFTVLFAAALALYLFASCSNSAGGGGTNPTPIQLPTPTPAPVAATYTVTFNANDGSENPATVTQTFTENRAESLKSFSEMGFSKSGFYFAGWGTSADATESAYADGAEYTANADITLYALWSAMPVYSVNVSSEHGTVTLSQATGIEGTEITLSNTPAIGWQFDSYTVIAEDGTAIVVDNDKFTLPAQNVTVTANYTIIDYAINVNSVSNGTVTVSSTANFGQIVTVTATPESDYYRFNSFVVTAADGTSLAVNGTGNTRTFVMPAQSVTISSTFDSKHTITLPTSIEGGTLTSNVTSAFEGDIVTLTVTPSIKYYVLNSVSATTSNTNISVSGDGNVKTFIMPGQDVSVNASLNLIFVPTPYNKINTKTINGVDYDIVEFGDWPQTILPKDSAITIDESKSVVQGDFTYCLGSDGNLYTKVKISAMMRIEKDLYFSDWSAVQIGESRWFKVEPINWRVLTTSFDHDGKDDTTGKKLLLAEYAIFGSWYSSYKTSGNENDYPTSYARKWLNSVHFLNTAFDSIGVSKIAYTTVDNSSRSTYPDDAKFYYNEENKWASGPTVDKIFLLSMQEVTRGEYGFSIRPSDDDARIHNPTDYARTSGNYCTTWFLRSPSDYLSTDVAGVNAKGYFVTAEYRYVRGFVPALCLE
ncbi:MAG: InlB B-repeat-containing protein [Treponema sp.]|nr:InlB B-repeat-containing protein [Treponema sp.]